MIAVDCGFETQLKPLILRNCGVDQLFKEKVILEKTNKRVRSLFEGV
jgi:hypothetical protein